MFSYVMQFVNVKIVDLCKRYGQLNYYIFGTDADISKALKEYKSQ